MFPRFPISNLTVNSGVFAAEIPNLPRASRMSMEMLRRRGNLIVMNLMCLGGSYWLQLIMNKVRDINPIDIHARLVRDVVFPAYKASTNNSTLHTTFLQCHSRLYVESSSCKEFMSNLTGNLARYANIFDFRVICLLQISRLSGSWILDEHDMTLVLHKFGGKLSLNTPRPIYNLFLSGQQISNNFSTIVAVGKVFTSESQAVLLRTDFIKRNCREGVKVRDC